MRKVTKIKKKKNPMLSSELKTQTKLKTRNEIENGPKCDTIFFGMGDDGKIYM